MAPSVFPNRRLFRLIKISRNYFSPDRRLFRFAYVSWHYWYSPKLPFISVCHCIMALTVFSYRCLFRLSKVSRHYIAPDHRLFRFCQSITASVFIPYCQISHYGRIWHFGYLSRLLRYFSFRTFISSPSWLDEPNDTLVSSLCWFGKRYDTLAHHVSILARWAEPHLRLIPILFGKPNDTSAHLIYNLVR